MSRIAIFGATSAIAESCAMLWARQGHPLFLVGRNPEKLDAVKHNLDTRFDVETPTLCADLDDLTQHDNWIQSAKQTLGSLDVLLIAHGILPSQEEAQDDFTISQDTWHTNFVSAASLLHHAARIMQEQSSGILAAISSVAGDRGRKSNYIYGTSKAALDTYLQGLRARLLPSGVHVLTIKPGFVSTPMTAHLHHGLLFARPEQIAKGIVRAVARKKNVVYLPWFWRWIMQVIRTIPEPVFKRLSI